MPTTDPKRNKRKTIADVLREEGEKRGELRRARRTLLRLLEQKFGPVPAETRAAIKATTSVKRLVGWTMRILTAQTLRQMQITASS
jgi:hypothetical protein